MIQAIELAGMKGRNASAFGIGYSLSGQHDPVILISAHNESTFRIHNWGSGAIVVLRQELRQVAPLAFPLRPDGPADSVLHRQLRRYLPAILRKQIKRSGYIGRIGLRSKL